MSYQVSKSTLGFGDFKSMAETGQVYGQDLTPGWYRSRFGFVIHVDADGRVWKNRADNTWLELHPGDHSIFTRLEGRPPDVPDCQ